MAPEQRPEQDVKLIWLPKGSSAMDADFAHGERWSDIDDAVIYAREQRREGMEAWIRCNGQFVLSPADIVQAYAQSKLSRR
jgi:hypothetical protein